jgi:hypothetical protein
MTCNSPNTLTVKTGDTLEFVANYSDQNGQAIDLSNITISANLVYVTGELVGHFSVTKLQSVGDYRMTLTIPAAAKTGTAITDIKYVTAGNVQHTDTVTVVITKAVTL